MGKRGRFQVLIFDFDYTLADSSRGAIECVNYALERMGLPRAPDAAVCRTIGLSLGDTFAALGGDRDAGSRERFTRLFTERADAAMADLTTLFEEVPSTIKFLQSEGIRLGIVSTKFRYRIEDILAREALSNAFDLIVGGEDVSRHKPHPEGVLKALTELKSPPADTLYVGDSVADAVVARRAGVPFAAVLSGPTTRRDFGRLPVLEFFESLRELPAFVRDGSRPG